LYAAILSCRNTWPNYRAACQKKFKVEASTLNEAGVFYDQFENQISYIQQLVTIKVGIY